MNSKTRHKPETGKLFIVATPIGNLKDITFRAVEVLKDVAVVAVEDTRISRRLLDYYGIDTKLMPCHDHNEAKAAGQIKAFLEQGNDVALISDAGTPLINDPGYQVVHKLRMEGFEILAVPGASSPVAALSASGLPTDRFTYLGFLPRKGKARSQVLMEIQQSAHTQVFLESPKRILKTLQDMLNIEEMQSRPCCIGRELTKLYEEYITGTVSEVFAQLSEQGARGEMVVMIGPGEETEVDDARILQVLEQMKGEGLSASALAKRVAKQLNVSRSHVYALLHGKE